MKWQRVPSMWIISFVVHVIFSLYVSITQEKNNEMTKAVFEMKTPKRP